MSYDNPTEYKGFSIGVTSHEINPGDWRGNFQIYKDGVKVHGETVLNFADNSAAAEENAIAVGKAVLDTKIAQGTI